MLKPIVVYDFVPTYAKIRQTIYSKVTITPSLGPWNVQWNTTFLSEVITNYRRGGSISLILPLPTIVIEIV